VALNPLIGIVRCEHSHRELIVVVCAEHSELAATLLLCGCMVALDGVYSCRLGVEQHDPPVAGDIINEQQEVVASSWGANDTGPQRSPCTSSSCLVAR
jgi:hypothetical protein